MVGVAQLVEPRIVIPVVVGSSPIVHPKILIIMYFVNDYFLYETSELGMNKFNIGVVGKGFVGNAVALGFSSGSGYEANIRIYDKDPSRSTHTLDEVVTKSDYIFISVPTPSNKDGSINLEILESCIKEIDDSSKRNDRPDSIILLRSTVVPGTTRSIQERYQDLDIVFNPEFLTERSAVFDFINQTRFILGGELKNTNKVAALIKDRFGDTIPIIQTDYESAELTKYVCNTYFATKISFLNEMKLICDSVKADWSIVMEGFLRDGRIGHSHVQVPGHDGKFGFGGSCFPKDVQAMIQFADELGIDLSVLKGTWKTNLDVRPEKDWESLKGRAVSD
jgi:nucleotide sugar dehydrogenase